MAEANPITLTLELVANGEPIDGRVRYADGDERPFTGWAGLIAAIDSGRAAGGLSGDGSGKAGA